MREYEPYKPSMQGTGTLDADTLAQCIAAMFENEPREPEPRSWDYVFTPGTLPMPRTFTFVSGQDDFPLYISRHTMHWFRKHQAQGNREHRRKLIARRQKRAAFRRRKRGR